MIHFVAPRAGAWIETSLRCVARQAPGSRPPCGGVDRNPNIAVPYRQRCGRPPCGGVDRNACEAFQPAPRLCRPPCGGVDRNILASMRFGKQQSRPPCGGVDRNRRRHLHPWRRRRRPPCGGVDRNAIGSYEGLRISRSPPVRGRGSKPCRRPWCAGIARTRRPPCGGVDRNSSAAIMRASEPSSRGFDAADTAFAAAGPVPARLPSARINLLASNSIIGFREILGSCGPGYRAPFTTN